MPEFTVRVHETRILEVTVEADSDQAVWDGDYVELAHFVIEDCAEQTTMSVNPA